MNALIQRITFFTGALVCGWTAAGWVFPHGGQDGTRGANDRQSFPPVMDFVPANVREEWRMLKQITAGKKTGVARLAEVLNYRCPEPLSSSNILINAAMDSFEKDPDGTVKYLLSVRLTNDQIKTIAFPAGRNGAVPMVEALLRLPAERREECREWLSQMGRHVRDRPAAEILRLAELLALHKPEGYEDFLRFAAAGTQEPAKAAELLAGLDQNGQLPAALKAVLVEACLNHCASDRKLELALSGSTRPAALEDAVFESMGVNPEEAISRLTSSRWGRLRNDVLEKAMQGAVKQAGPEKILDAIAGGNRPGLKVLYTLAASKSNAVKQ